MNEEITKFRITRREFFKLLGFAGLTLSLSPIIPKTQNSALAITDIQRFVVAGGPDFSWTYLRKEDLLYLKFDFFNLVLNGNTISRKNSSLPSFIVAQFQPQSIAEEAYYDASTNGLAQGSSSKSSSETPTNPPIPALISSPTRLAFKLPSGMNSINFSEEDLLDWIRYDPSLVGVAQSLRSDEEEDVGTFFTLTLSNSEDSPSTRIFKGTGTLEQLPQESITDQIPEVPNIAEQVPRNPQLTETAIEFPYRLIISPNRRAGWAHSILAKEKNGRYELWHTRLGVKVNEDGENHVDEIGHADDRTVRAVWSPDYNPENPPNPNSQFPFRMSLTPNDRHQLVGRTSDFSSDGHRPVFVNQLMLSSQGAWTDLFGKWSGDSFDLEDWAHKSTQGRDNFVRVVYGGYLFPFGHKAALVKITERKFEVIHEQRFVDPNILENPEPPKYRAYLRQRYYVVVREPLKKYQYGQRNTDSKGRNWPFKRVRITTLKTPNLNEPDDISFFWPQVGGNTIENDFHFHMIAQDVEGNIVEFNAPLIFVFQSLVNDLDRLEYLDKIRRLGNMDIRRTWNIEGQKIAFAPLDENSSNQGDTSLETDKIKFSWEVSEGKRMFYPTIALAEARNFAVQNITGSSEPFKVRYPSRYLTNGFDNDNIGEVFLELIDPSRLDFGGYVDQVGGIITPNLNIKGLSRLFGPIGGGEALEEGVNAIDSIANGTFDPSDFLPDDAKILGGIKLKDIIDKVTNFEDQIDKVPKLLTTEVEGGIETSYKWKLEGVADFKVHDVFEVRADCMLEIDARTTARFEATAGIAGIEGSGNAEFDISGKLRKFSIHIVDMIKVNFSEFSFQKRIGEGPTVGALLETINPIDFERALRYVDNLRENLPSGFDNVSYSISSSGIEGKISVEFPPISVGVLALENIIFEGIINLPFTGDPMRFTFSFAKRDSPFLITYGVLGGRGFVLVVVRSNEIETIEGSLEFGGYKSFDFAGVASGSLEVGVGIYIIISDAEAFAQGFIRGHGSVNVLGILNASITLESGLSYNFGSDCITYRASVGVRIGWGWASYTVHIHWSGEFCHTPSVKFQDLYPQPSHWSDYANAFSPEGEAR